PVVAVAQDFEKRCPRDPQSDAAGRSAGKHGGAPEVIRLIGALGGLVRIQPNAPGDILRLGAWFLTDSEWKNHPHFFSGKSRSSKYSRCGPRARVDTMRPSRPTSTGCGIAVTL